MHCPQMPVDAMQIGAATGHCALLVQPTHALLVSQNALFGCEQSLLLPHWTQAPAKQTGEVLSHCELPRHAAQTPVAEQTGADGSVQSAFAPHVAEHSEPTQNGMASGQSIAVVH
jgi:hypothetical protein